MGAEAAWGWPGESPAGVFAVSALAIAAISLPTQPTVALAHESVTNVLDGRVGSTYTQTLQQSGGGAPYTWSMANGSKLPQGLTLDASTGVISGKPTLPGLTEFAPVSATRANPACRLTKHIR